MTDTPNAPTLVIMAAGMGSRYGGLKQIDPVGPRGEIVLDYSAYDAIRAGFGKIVFIIRRDIEDAFRPVIEANIAQRIAVTYAYQELDDLPDGFTLPGARTKPLGTAHAIYACRDMISEPFAVINADDFYGRESFRRLAAYLRRVDPRGNDYCLVAYTLRNTLSDNGSVTRGVCRIVDNVLTGVDERHEIKAVDGGVQFQDGDRIESLTGEEPVSMNMWGFTSTLFRHIAEAFPAFLDDAAGNPKAEFLIPALVDQLVQGKRATVHALYSSARWLGVTYPEDKPTVSRGIRGMIDGGEYPDALWS